ncbi:GAF domain-containing protein [Streptomyces alkaliterrae]|uniref:GAF domain-containing protein n=1 Tax=Streptomyces alkaliterrae TaxID=2213162 RepID=A0A5P0YPW5_9ACTN|nr:GAF domain-containing protein [Streptomyces alkaliterrae]MBB1253318.1 GAF domain-containing protein [Streptomyces alkaliterrae]MBB1259277.1 GAF domain-containing protein [Streptomyces alkaliterrae]MQS02298.1 GAF domain-containing protein [Streptomyces alkaliterrae]
MPGNSPGNQTDNWTTALRYIAGRKAAEEALGFVAHVSATIRSTEEVKDVVPAVADVSVPFLASALSVDAPASRAERVVRGPETFTAALEGVRRLAETGDGARLVISAHEGLAKQVDPARLEKLREWGAESAVVLPLDYRGVAGGSLVLVRDGRHRRGVISPSELALVTEVADRLAAFNALAAANGPAGER